MLTTHRLYTPLDERERPRKESAEGQGASGNDVDTVEVGGDSWRKHASSVSSPGTMSKRGACDMKGEMGTELRSSWTNNLARIYNGCP